MFIILVYFAIALDHDSMMMKAKYNLYTDDAMHIYSSVHFNLNSGLNRTITTKCIFLSCVLFRFFFIIVVIQFSNSTVFRKYVNKKKI